MSSVAVRLARHLRVSAPTSSSSLGLQKNSNICCYSTNSLDSDIDEVKNDDVEGGFDKFLGNKPEMLPQGVDPRRGWAFRGVHKAIICGKIGQAPVQKILRNGRTITIFTVGTGGLFDQRIVGAKDLPKPAQWHRICVHNEPLGAYAVQQLAKNSCVYVEGEIETRVYNDSINGEVKSIPEICVRRDGRIRLVRAGESVNSISFDDLRKLFFSFQIHECETRRGIALKFLTKISMFLGDCHGGNYFTTSPFTIFEALSLYVTLEPLIVLSLSQIVKRIIRAKERGMGEFRPSYDYELESGRDPKSLKKRLPPTVYKKRKDSSSSHSSLKSWWNDPETKRKKRVAKYKLYAMEGKVKSSLKKSVKWMKKKYSRIVHGI
ncbi:hypothetical protein ACFE04_006332 [Oxalis oulophora]